MNCPGWQIYNCPWLGFDDDVRIGSLRIIQDSVTPVLVAVYALSWLELNAHELLDLPRSLIGSTHDPVNLRLISGFYYFIQNPPPLGSRQPSTLHPQKKHPQEVFSESHTRYAGTTKARIAP